MSELYGSIPEYAKAMRSQFGGQEEKSVTISADKLYEMEQECEKLRARIAELEAAQEWVSVRDRLPESNSVEVWETYPVLIDWYGKIVNGALYFEGGGWYSGNRHNYTAHVICWREWQLPQPPEDA